MRVSGEPPVYPREAIRAGRRFGPCGGPRDRGLQGKRGGHRHRAVRAAHAYSIAPRARRSRYGDSSPRGSATRARWSCASTSRSNVRSRSRSRDARRVAAPRSGREPWALDQAASAAGLSRGALRPARRAARFARFCRALEPASPSPPKAAARCHASRASSACPAGRRRSLGRAGRSRPWGRAGWLRERGLRLLQLSHVVVGQPRSVDSSGDPPPAACAR
jgi:hypothetical protein